MFKWREIGVHCIATVLRGIESFPTFRLTCFEVFSFLNFCSAAVLTDNKRLEKLYNSSIVNVTGPVQYDGTRPK